MKYMLEQDINYDWDSIDHSFYMAHCVGTYFQSKLSLGKKENGFAIRGLDLYSESELKFVITPNHLFYVPFQNFLGEQSRDIIYDSTDSSNQLLVERMENNIQLKFGCRKNNPSKVHDIFISDNSGEECVTRFYRLFSDLFILFELYNNQGIKNKVKAIYR